MTEPVRLSKRLIELTACTRREAELYIEGGWVTVNGVVVEQPQCPVTDEAVALLPNADLTSAGPITLLLHRPAQVTAEQAAAGVSAASHWSGGNSGGRLLKRHFRYLNECFPLEPEASGLCVLSQNRHLARRWLDLQATLEQEYVVDFEGVLSESGLARLNQVVNFKGKRLPPAKVSLQKETRLRFALKNPLPGQILHLCSAAEIKVTAMTRLRLGAVLLRKLPLGQWRYLPDAERF